MKNIPKIKRTTFGIVSSHIISSSTLFPLFWLIVGSIGKLMLIENYMVNSLLANGIYYVFMLLSFYFGIKYSLYYINKKVLVSFPQESGRQSIIFFSLLVLATNYGLFHFEDSINIMRIFFSFTLVYMFSVMTKKYFDTLEKVDYFECNFMGQVTVLLANFSIFISLIVLYSILTTTVPIAKFFIPLILLLLGLKTEIFNKIFVSFFYKNHNSKPIKYALIVLAITLPLNIGLYFVFIHYFEINILK